MSRNVREIIAQLPDAQRAIVERRTAELIAEQMTLREVRLARKKTQASVAHELGISQDGVSRLEKRSDLLISTLRRTLETMDGKLSLVVEFPDRPAITLAGIGEDEQEPRPKRHNAPRAALWPTRGNRNHTRSTRLPG